MNKLCDKDILKAVKVLEKNYLCDFNGCRKRPQALYHGYANIIWRLCEKHGKELFGRDRERCQVRK